MLQKWRITRVQRGLDRIYSRAVFRSYQTFGGSSHRTSLDTIHSIAGRKNAIIPNHFNLYRNHRQQSCSLFTEAVPGILVPPVIFVGLLISLWTWKCFWIVVMQNKLLYLSWLPPFARSEKVADYVSECKPVQWEEKQIRSLDGTKLAVCEGRLPLTRYNLKSREIEGARKRGVRRKKKVVICYFQGNGGSTPLRLPLLSHVLRAIREQSSDDRVEYCVAALSYRGYWTSYGRATESGIELDAQAFLHWVSDTLAAPETDLEVIIWGHSLGAAIATTATVTYLARDQYKQPSTMIHGSSAHISGLILEAPISSTKEMLIDLYPQKWLPYRYLWPFLRSHWNTFTALTDLAHLQHQRMPILLLSAEKDEVIPPYVADSLEKKAETLRLDLERKHVLGAMHIEAPLKMEGRQAMVNFIFKCTSADNIHSRKVGKPELD